MASPFDVFDWQPFTVHRHTSPTSGHYDENDIWVPPEEAVPEVIQGHLTLVDRLNRESAWIPGQTGVMEGGQLRFIGETELQQGDVLEVEQEGSKKIHYRVMDLVQAHRLMARVLQVPVRYEYAVREMPR